MAWNGSNNSVGRSVPDRRNQTNSQTPKPSNFQTPKPSNFKTILRGLLAGLIVAALGGAAVWWFLGGRGATCPTGAGGDGSRPFQIATVSPQIATNRPVAAKPAVQPPPKELPPQIAGEIRNGYRLLANGRLHKVVGVHTSRVARTTLAMKTFDHPGNQTIASLLTITPGDSLLGDSSMYFQDFDQHFRESAEEKIGNFGDRPRFVQKFRHIS